MLNLNDQRASTSHVPGEVYDGGVEEEDEQQIREIHALTPPPQPTNNNNRGHRRDNQLPWGTQHSHQSSLVSIANTDVASSENFTSMSREFSALVLAGSSVDHNSTTSPMMMSGNSYSNERETNNNININNNLRRIREDELMEETNPLAIVPDNNPLELPVSPTRRGGGGGGVGGSSSSASASAGTIGGQSEVTVQRVRKEEVEAKIAAWQNAKVSKINNRFKREDAVINGWETEQVQKANSWMKKVEFFMHCAEEARGEKSKST